MAMLMHETPEKLPKLYWIITIPYALLSLLFVTAIVLGVSYPRHIWTMTKRIITTGNPYLLISELRP